MFSPNPLSSMSQLKRKPAAGVRPDPVVFPIVLPLRFTGASSYLRRRGVPGVGQSITMARNEIVFRVDSGTVLNLSRLLLVIDWPACLTNDNGEPVVSLTAQVPVVVSNVTGNVVTARFLRKSFDFCTQRKVTAQKAG